MKCRKYAKASGFEEGEIPSVCIEIRDEIPSFSGDGKAGMLEGEKFFDSEAKCLADALFQSLPQGTFDRLIIKLIQKKTSLYRGVTDSPFWGPVQRQIQS